MRVQLPSQAGEPRLQIERLELNISDMKKLLIVSSALVAAASFSVAVSQSSPKPSGSQSVHADAELSRAVFAGGCFWCVESDFDKVEGVVRTTSGYTGGRVDHPTYKQVTRGGTGHYEAVEVVYDPDVVSYDYLVDYFFRHVDPTDAGGQFCDRGDSYRTAVFAADDAQEEAAKAEIEMIEASGVLAAPIVTPVLKLDAFWPAEAYHQDYYTKNPLRYRFYRTSCGRDKRVAQVWSELKASH